MALGEKLGIEVDTSGALVVALELGALEGTIEVLGVALGSSEKLGLLVALDGAMEELGRGLGRGLWVGSIVDCST